MNFRILRTFLMLLSAAILLGAAINTRIQNAQVSEPSRSPAAALTQETPAAPVYKLLTKADVRQAFREIPTKPPTNKKIIDEADYNASVARVAGRSGPPEQHRDSDRIFFVEKGAALMRIGGTITDREETAPGEYRSKSGAGYTGFDTVRIKAGTILSVPRNVAYQIVAEKADISFIVVRIN